jgi:DNA-directed RNA polymerase specialized sigma24 family protein
MDRDLLIRALRPLLPDLTRFCLWLTGPDAHGADLVQDVVLRALQQGDTITEPARLKSWLFRTARNAYVDTRRARAKAASRELLPTVAGAGTTGNGRSVNPSESVPTTVPR